MDKLSDLVKETSEKMKDNNNKYGVITFFLFFKNLYFRLIQGTFILLCDITKELNKKIQDATSENVFFAQPKVKSALEMLKVQLEWINNLIEDYMKNNKLVTESKASIDVAGYKTPNDEVNTIKSKNTMLSFKSQSPRLPSM